MQTDVSNTLSLQLDPECNVVRKDDGFFEILGTGRYEILVTPCVQSNDYRINKQRAQLMISESSGEMHCPPATGCRCICILPLDAHPGRAPHLVM